MELPLEVLHWLEFSPVKRAEDPIPVSQIQPLIDALEALRLAKYLIGGFQSPFCAHWHL